MAILFEGYLKVSNKWFAAAMEVNIYFLTYNLFSEKILEL